MPPSGGKPQPSRECRLRVVKRDGEARSAGSGPAAHLDSDVTVETWLHRRCKTYGPAARLGAGSAIPVPPHLATNLVHLQRDSEVVQHIVLGNTELVQVRRSSSVAAVRATASTVTTL